MSNVSMTGVTGRIDFGDGADAIRNVKIERIQGTITSLPVGIYKRITIGPPVKPH